jgi:hypothetical protein
VFQTQGFYAQNETTYLELTFWVSPAGSTTFGGEIVRALNRSEVATASRAAAVVTCMLDENPAVKNRLLSIPLELTPPPGQPPTLLMPQCISHLSNAIYSPGWSQLIPPDLFIIAPI